MDLQDNGLTETALRLNTSKLSGTGKTTKSPRNGKFGSPNSEK